MEVLVPVIKEVDVLIVGAMLSGCELSLRLRKAGRNVLVTTSGTSLGDDLVGRLDRDALNASGLFADCATTPAEIQKELDRLLLDAGVDFLFGVIPIRPLYETGTRRLAGWIFFGGNSYFGIAAKAVVDGTCDGVLPFQMRLNRRSSGIAECLVQWNLIGTCRPVADIPGATLEASLTPLAVDGSSVPFCQYKRPFRLRQNDTAGILHADMLLRKDVLTSNTLFPAPWPKFGFTNQGWTGVVTSTELPLYRAGTADVTMLLRETIPAVPIAKTFQNMENRQSPTDFLLQWKSRGMRSTPGHVRVNLSLESLETEAPDVDLVVAGAGIDGIAAARTAARKGLRVLLLAPGDSVSGELAGVVSDGVEVWFHTVVGGVLMHRHDVAGVLVLVDDGTSCLVHAPLVIDATGCGAIAAGAGAPMHYPQEVEPITHGAVVAPRAPSNPFETSVDLRYFLNDPWDMTCAFVLAHLQGTDFAIKPPSPKEARPRILGEITILPQDIVLNHHYVDTIAVSRGVFTAAAESCHPLLWMEDLNQAIMEPWIPFRAILPLRVEGMLVIGKALSAQKDAARVCGGDELLFREGTAAALLACQALKSGTLLRKLDLRPVQEELVSQGMLPPEILAVQEDLPSQNALSLAEIFHRPDQARRILQAQFERRSDLRTAIILAFLGDSSGRDILAKSLFDMVGIGDGHEFCTLASAFATIGGSPAGMLGKLDALTPQTPLRVLRVLCLFFQRWPSREAVPSLRSLLEEMQTELPPQVSGLAAVVRATENNCQNSRLKCLYLAGALHACDPSDSEANEFLKQTCHSWRLMEALFAYDAGK